MNAKRKIPTIHLIATDASAQADKLIHDMGLTPAKDWQDRVEKLQYIGQHWGEEALEHFAELHPDRELILEYAKRERGERDSSFNAGERGIGQRYLNPYPYGMYGNYHGEKEHNCGGCGMHFNGNGGFMLPPAKDSNFTGKGKVNPAIPAIMLISVLAIVGFGIYLGGNE